MYKKKIILFCKYGLAVMILLLVGVFGFKVTMNASDTSNVVTYVSDPGINGFVQVGYAEYDSHSTQKYTYNFGTKFNTDINLSDKSGTLRIRINSDDDILNDSYSTLLYFDILNFNPNQHRSYDAVINGFNFASLEYSSSGTFITVYSQKNLLTTWLDITIYATYDNINFDVESNLIQFEDGFGEFGKKYITNIDFDNSKANVLCIPTSLSYGQFDGILYDITNQLENYSVYYCDDNIYVYLLPIYCLDLVNFDLYVDSNLITRSNIYAGSLDDFKSNFNIITDNVVPIISVNNYIYVTNVSNPVSINDLKLNINLVAYDEIDGDLTYNIVTSSDGGYIDNVLNKEEKFRVLGEYPILFSVKDSSNNEATATIIIKVVDTIKPVLDLDNSVLSYSVNYYDEKELLTIVDSKIIVNDNHTMNLSKTIIEDTYTPNSGQIGNYYAIIRYSDESGNYVDVHVSIKVIDSFKPKFTGANAFYKSYDVAKTVNDIIDFCNIVCSDEVDGVLTIANGGLTILNDNYTGKANIPGIYTIVLRGQDKAGNYEDFTLTITVGDDVVPFFMVDKTKIIIEPGVKFTSNQLIQTLKDVGKISNSSLSYTVTKDTYTGNEELPGTYDYNLKVLYANGVEEKINLKVVVLSETTDPGIIVKPEKNNIFKSIWDFILKCLKFIWRILVIIFNFFVGLFKKIL